MYLRPMRFPTGLVVAGLLLAVLPAQASAQEVLDAECSAPVVATDVAGNVDPSPASDDWKVKKRHRK